LALQASIDLDRGELAAIVSPPAMDATDVSDRHRRETAGRGQSRLTNAKEK